MTGAPQLPPNALDEARELLYEVLVGVFTAVGWSKGRADKYPPATAKVPGSWVDAATLSAQGNGTVATFPIGLAVDGTDRAQVERLDAFTAMLWARLEAVRIPDTAELLPKGSTLQVMTAGPEQLDVGGPNTRALALTVQVPIGPRTLCPTALTGDPTP